MKRFFLKHSFIVLAMIGVMTACNEDDKEVITSDNCEEELTLADFQRDAYNSLVEKNFTKVVNGADTLLQMTCGLESFNGESNTRYAIAENATNAISLFSSQFGYIISENLVSSEEDNGFTIPLGEYGYVKYLLQPTNTAAFATAEVKLQGMPYPMYIQYVPKSYVPNNSNGPYEQGMLVDINGELWLCATSWGGGSTPGTLIRFVDRNDNLLQNRGDHYKNVYFQKNPVSADTFNGLEYLFKWFKYKDDLYETIKSIVKENNDLKEMKHLLDVMDVYRGTEYTPEELINLYPSLSDIWAKYVNSYIFKYYSGTVTFNDYCQLNGVFLPKLEAMKFNTGYYCSSKDYHWKCARYLYKLELKYVTISAGSFEYKSSGTHHHEWNCKDLGDKYFKNDAPCLAEVKEFTYKPLENAEIIWPTVDQ